MIRRTPAHFIIALTVLATVATAQPWRYIEAPDSVPQVSLRLGTQAGCPAGLELDIERGGEGRFAFAELRFGSPGAVPIALVMHELADDVRLYADADRDRQVTAEERLARDGDGWSEDLFLILLDGSERRLIGRRVLLRWSPTVGILEVMIPGWIEGEVTLEGRTLAVRRWDGDANGHFTDAADQVWIDWNSDGRFDPFAERFPFRPVLRIEGQRLALRSDAYGESLWLAPASEMGEVSLKKDPASIHGEVRKVSVILQSGEGDVGRIDSFDAPARLPAGTWRLKVVVLTLGRGQRPLTFVFSDSGGRDEKVWYTVTPDEPVIVDPIGTLAMQLRLSPERARPGTNVKVEPLLYTADGLLINTVFAGPTEGGYFSAGVTTRLTHEGRTLVSASSGFA
jgi:hypothetical protein